MTEGALDLCDEKIQHYQKKATHNKNESLRSFYLIMGATLAVPMFVSLSGDNFLLGKVTPSILSLMASFCTAWLQLRKPQALWGLYRTAERRLEIHRESYRFHLGDFEKATDKERVLAQKTMDVYKDTHDQWLQLIPDVKDLKQTGKPDRGENKPDQTK